MIAALRTAFQGLPLSKENLAQNKCCAKPRTVGRNRERRLAKSSGNTSNCQDPPGCGRTKLWAWRWSGVGGSTSARVDVCYHHRWRFGASGTTRYGHKGQFVQTWEQWLAFKTDYPAAPRLQSPAMRRGNESPIASANRSRGPQRRSHTFRWIRGFKYAWDALRRLVRPGARERVPRLQPGNA